MTFLSKHKWMLGVIPFALTVIASPLHATPVEDEFFSGELNQLSDNSGESQGVDGNSDGFLDVGDTLRGTLDFDTNEDLSGGGGTNDIGANGVNELSGIFEVQVTSKVFENNGADGVLGTADDVYNFTFGPNAAFIAEFSLPANSLIALYEDATPNYDRTGTIATAETTATDGTLQMVLGFGLDGDELWAAQGPQDPSLGAGIAAGSAFGVFNFQVSILLNNFNYTFGQVAAGTTIDDGLIDINASGQLLGTLGATTDYDIFNNVDATHRPQAIPEPGVLALLGIGLLGIGVARRRNKRAS